MSGGIHLPSSQCSRPLPRLLDAPSQASGLARPVVPLPEQPTCQTLFLEKKLAPGAARHAFPKPILLSSKTRRRCLPEALAWAVAPAAAGLSSSRDGAVRFLARVAARAAHSPCPQTRRGLVSKAP